MFKNIYQMVYELNCNELYFLRDREHMQRKAIKQILEEKCLRKN